MSGLEVCAKVKRMNARQQLRIRLWISLAFGLIVTSVARSTVGGTRSRDAHHDQKRHANIGAPIADISAGNINSPQVVSGIQPTPSV